MLFFEKRFIRRIDLHEEVEKSLVVGGLLISLGVGGCAGFWAGVLVAGVLLFGVAFLVFAVALLGCRDGRDIRDGREENTAGSSSGASTTRGGLSADGAFDGRRAA